MQICQSYIGGRSWPSNQPPIDKFYAATGEVIARVEPATNDMLDEAVGIASEAQRSWAALEARQRGEILQRAASLMRTQNNELARLEVMDVGKCFGEAVSADVPSGPDALAYFAALAQTVRKAGGVAPEAERIVGGVRSPPRINVVPAHLCLCVDDGGSQVRQAVQTATSWAECDGRSVHHDGRSLQAQYVIVCIRGAAAEG